jgi:osmotically-inducible protein OsmY
MTPTRAALLSTLLFLVAGTAGAVPEPADLTPMFIAGGVSGIDRLQVFELGGVVLIRGRSFDRTAAEDASRFAQSRGYQRIANLVQVVEPPDDRAIERTAERALTIYRALEGCRFRVASDKGIVRLGGTVQHDQQMDVAMQLVRNIDGVREVRAAFERE